eukprot:TRINITY_DN3460_c3_g1_i1.p1 TRINITY_DN3460_c3_g1~~TRINITY_DN3460_c3_g1_i1.p1  ORF type:complete len:563 (+),score=149.52 TRINITY_DN3460_c3_g1_i1:159-1847(+)
MASSLPRERLVQLIVTLLAKKGDAMAAELDRKVAAGKGLEVRGINVDTTILKEALAQHRGENAVEDGVLVGDRAPSSSSKASIDRSPATSAAPKAATSVMPSSPEAAAAPAADADKKKPVASARWNPAGGSGAAGARWNPGASSASLLTAKALQECEQAEPFSRNVLVSANLGKVAVFGLPDVLTKPMEQQLDEGQDVEVVARYLSQRDGRVYLRLKADKGWVCTRSIQDLTHVVLSCPEVPGQSSLEPEKFRLQLKSPAMEVLPILDSPDAPPTAVDESMNDADEDYEGLEDDEDGEDEADGLEGDEGEEGANQKVEGDGNEPPEDDAQCHSQTQEDGEGDLEAEFEGDGDGEGDEDGDGAASSPGPKTPGTGQGSSPSKVRRQVRKFKVLGGRCSLLEVPGASNLMAIGQTGQKALSKDEEFYADGVYYIPSEQRAYLRLTRGRGWICERSRTDVHKLAIAKCSMRKAPLSKKMARVVAFRGGDAGKHCHLKQDDLVKNKYGKIVSKKASEAAKKRYAEGGAAKWGEAVKKARAELGVTGFAVVKKGTALYEKAQEYYKK